MARGTRGLPWGAVCGIHAAVVLASLATLASPPYAAQGIGTRIEVSFPNSLRGEPVTGRLFVALSPTKEPEPRIAAYNSARARTGKVPFFAIDVDQLQPGQTAVIDATSIGFPYWSLKDLPAGDYYLQALLNVYTQFRSCRWSRHLGPHGSVGGPAVGVLTRKPGERAPACPRSTRSRRRSSS